MEYLFKALKKSKSLYLQVLQTLMQTVALIINAEILAWISEVFTNYDDPIIPITKILIGCLINIILDSAINWIDAHTMHRLYGELLFMYLDKITGADYDMFTKHSPGHLISALNGLKYLTKLPRDVMVIITSILRFLVTSAAMVLISRTVGIPIIGIFSIAGVVLYKVIKEWGKLDDEVDNLRREKVKITEETISGFAELRSFDGAQERQYRNIMHNNNITVHTLDARNRITILNTVTYLSADTVMMMVIIFIALSLLKNDSINSATAVVLLTYAWRLIEPLVTAINGISAVSEEISSLPKFQEVMQYENTVSTGTLILTEFNDNITFHDVGFAYESSDNVLDGATFTIKKGQHIGICGPSGGGKSTITKLIPKFYDVTSGRITIDGVDIRNYTQDSIRKNMGIVHQDPYIFDTTILENLRFVRNNDISMREIKWACQKACIYDFIMSLPNGFDTNVGPRGMKLSGGQKQRIAIARLFLADPDIIIMDEATSALDVATERAIQRAIDEFKDKTVIVVAHRLSTIKKSDKIIVINNHCVAEEGTHEQLITKGGQYAEMVRLSEEECSADDLPWAEKTLQYIPVTNNR